MTSKSIGGPKVTVFWKINMCSKSKNNGEQHLRERFEKMSIFRKLEENHKEGAAYHLQRGISLSRTRTFTKILILPYFPENSLQNYSNGFLENEHF